MDILLGRFRGGLAVILVFLTGPANGLNCTLVQCVNGVKNALISEAVRGLQQIEDKSEEDLEKQARMLIAGLIFVASIIFFGLIIGLLFIGSKHLKKWCHSGRMSITAVRPLATSQRNILGSSRKSSAFFSYSTSNKSSFKSKNSETKPYTTKSEPRYFTPGMGPQPNQKTLSVHLRENGQLREIEPITIIPGARIKSDLPFPCPYPVNDALAPQFIQKPSKKVTRQYSSVKYSLNSDTTNDSCTTLDVDSVLSKSSYTSRTQSTASFDAALKELENEKASQFITDIMADIDNRLSHRGLTPKNSFISAIKPAKAYLTHNESFDSAVVESISES